MSIRGQGDRWLAGERVEGVDFEHHAPVEIVAGALAGRRGSVALLMGLGADPLYLVKLSADGGDVRVWQSALRRAS